LMLPAILLPDYVKVFTREKRYSSDGAGRKGVAAAMAGMTTRWKLMPNNLVLLPVGRRSGNAPRLVSHNFDLLFVFVKEVWTPSQPADGQPSIRPILHALPPLYANLPPLTSIDGGLPGEGQFQVTLRPLAKMFREREAAWKQAGFGQEGYSRRGGNHLMNGRRQIHDGVLAYPALAAGDRLMKQNSGTNDRWRACAEKSTELLMELLFMYTDPSDRVLDMCAGTGSTALACAMTGRNFLGFELESVRRPLWDAS
jgi:hypothetical protein